jgi:nucleoside-diphosphate-sugar epimerase
MAVLLLTGSTGFKGSWILQMLEESELAMDSVYDTLRLLVRDPGKLKGYGSKRYRIEVVEGTKALINSLKPGTRFVLTSTYGVYGFPNKEKPIDEDFETKRPIWHYQKSKKAQEEMARKLCGERDIRFCALRPPTTIGPRERLFVPGVITFIREGKLMLINGVENIIPLAHGEDAARAHLLALKQIDKNDGEAFHFESFNVPFKE